MVVRLLLLELLLLPLRLIVHRVRPARLIQQRLALLAMRDLLVLLHEIARRAAARTEAVLAAVAGQVVLCANLAAVQQRHDPRKAHAGQGCEASALRRVLVDDGSAEWDWVDIRSCCSMSSRSCCRCSSSYGACARTRCRDTTMRGSLGALTTGRPDGLLIPTCSERAAA
jgi:hypothetical protein